MKWILPVISFMIVLSGLFIYLSWNVQDYVRGVEAAKTMGTDENFKVNQHVIQDLMAHDQPEKALDLLLKLVAADQKNLDKQITLAAFYFQQCKEEETHCEEALWQVNVLMHLDSTNTVVRQIKSELDLLLAPKIPAN